MNSSICFRTMVCKKRKKKPKLQLTDVGHPEVQLPWYKNEENVQARGTLQSDDDEC